MSDRRFTFAVHRLAAELDRHADRLLRTHLTLTYAEFLQLVMIADGCASMSELGVRLGLTRAAISKKIPDLEARGLVRVHRNGRDHALQVTPAGTRLVNRASDLLEGEFRARFAAVEDDLDHIGAMLDHLTDELRSDG